MKTYQLSSRIIMISLSGYMESNPGPIMSIENLYHLYIYIFISPTNSVCLL